MYKLIHYLKRAQQEKFAIGQFNFSTFEQVKGIVEAAKILKSPIVLGTSEGESKFFGLKEAVAIRDVLRKETGVPIFLNLDHGKSFEYIKQAIDAGYDMVHFDGSKLPFEENVKISKQVKKYAKWRGILVEGELGVIGTESSKVYEQRFEIKEELLTNPEKSVEYIHNSKVDLLAVSIGNFHGMDAGGESPHLKLDVLKNISFETKGFPLVLHGGSGTPEEDIKESIKLGIVKININTELRLAFTNSLRKGLADLQEITPYKYLPSVIVAVQKVAEYKIKLFQSADKI